MCQKKCLWSGKENGSFEVLKEIVFPSPGEATSRSCLYFQQRNSWFYSVAVVLGLGVRSITIVNEINDGEF